MTQKTPKTPIIYDCNYCEFVSCNKKDYKRHLSTRKHKMMTNDDAKKPYIYSCDCGNKYKYRQGLFNHKKKCKNICKLEDSELESEVESNAENPDKYHCEKCQFVCSKKSNYINHISTRKHEILTNTYKKLPDEYACFCGKIYKHRQSLHSHKKTCEMNISQELDVKSEVDIVLDVESISETQPIQIMFSEMKKENKEMRQELQKMILVQQENIRT